MTNNRLVEIKKDRFIKELKKKYHNEAHFKRGIDKIIISKSELHDETRTLWLETYDNKGEKTNSFTYISSDDKLQLIYHVISLISENVMDAVKFWESIIDFPDELIEHYYE